MGDIWECTDHLRCGSKVASLMIVDSRIMERLVRYIMYPATTGS